MGRRGKEGTGEGREGGRGGNWTGRKWTRKKERKIWEWERKDVGEGVGKEEGRRELRETWRGLVEGTGKEGSEENIGKENGG